MTETITVVAGEHADLDDVQAVIAELANEGMIEPFIDEDYWRPAVSVQGIEVLVDSKQYEAVCQRFERDGFEVIGGGDS
jgi:hypothetical protein